MKLVLTFLLCAMAAPLAAGEWALRDSDYVLTHDEVDTLTAGKTIVFYDDGKSKYSVGGSYSYTYASGDSAFGHYTISPDGTVCVAYRNGMGRCDRYVRSGEKIILLTENGLRFPIRPSAKK